MDKNINSGNNSMNSLCFFWKARFKDNNEISQFDNNGIEHRFEEVKDKFNDLRYFYLTNNIDQTFTVDLINGLIFFNNHLSIEKAETKQNCRLIFFRRHQIEIGTNTFKEKNHIINYHLGFQYNDKLGNNRQVVLIIDNEGNWCLDE